MAIDFRCPQCNKLLRTQDDTAGKQTKCPECGAAMTIPTPQAGFQTPLPPLQPAGGDQGSPFGASEPAEPAGSVAEPADAGDPYHSPRSLAASGPYEPSSSLVTARVSAPAIALMVLGGLGIALQGFGILMNLVNLVAGVGAVPNARPEEGVMLMFSGGVGLAIGVIGLLVSIVIIVGARKMQRLENYGFAMAASILAMIPCISPCCLLGIPFGIWAIVVLSDPNVKAAFRG